MTAQTANDADALRVVTQAVITTAKKQRPRKLCGRVVDVCLASSRKGLRRWGLRDRSGFRRVSGQFGSRQVLTMPLYLLLAFEQQIKLFRCQAAGLGVHANQIV